MGKEILIWSDKTWSEIPKQDNPAFNYINDEPKNGREWTCFMICKVLEYESNVTGKNGYVVIEVPKNGDVIRRGVFWLLEYAKIFAEALAEKIN